MQLLRIHNSQAQFNNRFNYRAGVNKEFVEEGSNLVVKNDLEIIANNNLNITNSKNTQTTSSYSETTAIDTGITVGNAYADVVNGVLDAAEAIKQVNDARLKLQKIEDLNDKGQASDIAVERAKYQLGLASLNAGLATYSAVQNTRNVPSSSPTFGFYGAGYVDVTKSKATSESEITSSVASNLITGNNLSLTSNQSDINITGSVFLILGHGFDFLLLKTVQKKVAIPMPRRISKFN